MSEATEAAYRVAIVGAGLAGLTAAAHLAGGSVGARPVEVMVVDKGRSPGGRLATRRIGEAVLDHGAQFFTVRSDAFRRRVERWQAAGAVEEWSRGFGTIDGYPRYRVAGGMNRLAKDLTAEVREAGVEVVSGQRVDAIIPGPDRWSLTYEGGSRDIDEADAVVATPPVPQVLDVLRSGATALEPDVTERLEAMAYHKVVAILAVLDRSPALPPPGALQRPDHPTFTFVADNQAKGISPKPAVTFHLAHPLSARLWDRDDDEVMDEVGDELRSTIGEASIVEVQVKRWRFAGPVEPQSEPSLLVAERPGPLVVAGDGFAGAKVEGAFLSGQDAASTILHHGAA